MGTKQSPGQFDCYANALPDEPMFVLLARDPNAPTAVRRWADSRELYINMGQAPESDRAIVAEARGCAAAMEQWRGANNGRWRAEKAPPSMNAELLAACKAQHEALDILMTMLIARSPPEHPFYPSKSGKPWEAMKAGHAAIAKAEAV